MQLIISEEIYVFIIKLKNHILIIAMHIYSKVTISIEKLA